jgi:hypothetical protein
MPSLRAIRSFLLLLSILLFAQGSLALGFGLEAGFRQQSGDAGTFVTSSQNGYQFGVSSVYKFSEKLALKSGLFYIERPLNYNDTTLSTEVRTKSTYFDVPVYLMYLFEDYAGVYIGPSVAMLLSQRADTASGTTLNFTDKKSMLIPITLGAHFKFAPDYGLNLFFETISADIANPLRNYRAVGANFILTFD